LTLYHKEPTRSSRFVNKKIWQETKKTNPSLLLCHARGASPGVGLSIYNKNNHPFVNEDLSLALIHNGRVPNHVYKSLIKNYQVKSTCDSEILLRVFQSACFKDKLSGVKRLMQDVFDAHMAIAIGQVFQKEKRLYLLRNEFRSLYCVDLTEELNQIFFVSTLEIWNESINNLELNNYKIQEIPVEEVWLIEFINNKLLFDKFEIRTEGFDIYDLDKYYNFNDINFSNKKIYTNLNEKEESLESDVNSIINSKEICSNIINNLYEIEENLENYSNYDDLSIKLSNIEDEILNILKIIKK
jgi:glucosamine 6-phosphate synthetase-like amidotransferase/phosphosugar isomerase protein